MVGKIPAPCAAGETDMAAQPLTFPISVTDPLGPV